MKEYPTSNLYFLGIWKIKSLMVLVEEKDIDGMDVSNVYLNCI